jgi:hypothetical protein
MSGRFVQPKQNEDMYPSLISLHSEIAALFPSKRVVLNIAIGNYLADDLPQVTYSITTAPLYDDEFTQVATGETYEQLMRACRGAATTQCMADSKAATARISKGSYVPPKNALPPPPIQRPSPVKSGGTQDDTQRPF